MDTTTIFVLVSGVLVVGMVVTAIVMFKDQTAPILGNPNQRPAQKNAEQASAVQDSPPSVPAVHSKAQLSAQSTLSAEVQSLLAQNHKIEAIKQLRSETGLGLAEAKALIDGALGEQNADIPSDIGRARSRVKELILAGRKIEAIKLWRETTGADLKTAKDEIDRISLEQ